MLVFFTILLGLLSLPFTESQTSTDQGGVPDAVTVDITAKKYEFSPSVITVTKGQRVKLNVTSLDTHHGLEIKDYNVDMELKKGVPATAEFVADREGEFTFKCSNFCGLGHSKMKGKLIVKPAAE